MQNKPIATVPIKLRGKEWQLKATHEALFLMEEKAGIGLMGLTYKAASGVGLSFRQMCAVVWGGLIGGGYKEDWATFEDVADELIKVGTKTSAVTCSKLLTIVMQGTDKAEAEASKKKSNKKKSKKSA